ncbi:MAG: hypothetical protein RBU30_07325 [Polyangia bacterium]|jgi:hypothetical protein|nr:hypothetical protein [Polyangia bacterium]
MIKNILKYLAATVVLIYSSSAFASAAPHPYNVRIRNASSGNWSNWTPYYTTGYTCGGDDWCELWDVAIEQGSADSGNRFSVWYYDEGTEYDYAYMYCNYSYYECFYSHSSYPTYDNIFSKSVTLEWNDNQPIAYIVHDDNGDGAITILRVQLYTIGK